MTEPTYLYGLHEPGGYDVIGLPEGSWIVFTEELGHDPSHMGGMDYRPYSERGINVIARLNNGYHPHGTIPAPAYYADFAQRVENFVRASQGCHRWIIGNEPNHPQEWPNDQSIHAAQYVDCYNLCAGAVLAAQPGAEVIPAPVAPWSALGTPSDWLAYFDQLMRYCRGIGAIALHTYTHGADPALITSNVKMDVPYENRLYHFRAYLDFLALIPTRLHDRHVYITETNQDQPWENVNSGWVKEAYKEIDGWNRSAIEFSAPIIHCLALYRWPNFDDRHIIYKDKVQEDMRDAIKFGYIVPVEKEPPVGTNLLVNGDLEHPYEAQLDDNGHPMQTIQVAHGWRGWWYSVAPEFKPVEAAFPNRVKEGATAQQFFKNFDKPNGGILQVVTGLEPGSLYRLTGWVQVWTSGEDDPDYSNGRAWNDLGVSPYGETDPDDPDNLWSTPVRAYDDYVQVSLEFTAPSDRATIFCRSVFEWPMRNQNAYWDALELVKVDDGTEPPDEPPPDGDGFKQLYKAKSVEAAVLRDAYAELEAFYANLADNT